MKVPDDHLQDMKVLMTMVYGKPAFAEPSFAEEVKWAGIPAQRAVPPENYDEDKPERE
jgi:hypothetical protein